MSASPGHRNLIGLYDAVSGDLKIHDRSRSTSRVNLASDACRWRAVCRERRQAGEDRRWQAEPDFGGAHVDSPGGVAFDAAGNVYVANHGAASQNVSVFTADGKYLRSIGRRGGRPVVMGEYMIPAGCSIPPAFPSRMSQGKRWVPEAGISMKRLSVWDTKTGKLAKEFFGGCSSSPFAWIDPKNPKEAFFDNTIWKIDLNKGTWYPKSIFYAPKSANAVNTGNGGFFFPWRVFTARNGHQYAVSQVYPYGPAVWIREGDLFRPLQFLFRNRPNPVLADNPPFPIMDDRKVYPGLQLTSACVVGHQP